ncbi:MAG: hypothetical protein KKE57_07270 [Proteobacteria bacterium]|nr:hypothetical protein [Pseudomonadota bacterium]
MNREAGIGIVEIIGMENFEWLSKGFTPETRLRDIPDEILNRLSLVDIAVRDYSADRNAITAIALITFAYRMGGKTQSPQYGTNDILLLKVLAKNEILRREGNQVAQELWELPLFELITGEVGEKIRATKVITNPI